MAVLGEVYELNASSVNEYSIEKLKSRVNEEPEAIYFDCCLCGGRRTADINDPGFLLLRDYTCADSKGPTSCKKSTTPISTKRSGYFVPGSLVICPLSNHDSTRWPGIIEDCPDGTDSYMIPGKISDEAKAYFVTFIFPKKADCRWVGGFMRARDVHPFALKDAPSNSTGAYRKSIVRACRSAPRSLKERLLDFSFVAHVASLRDIRISDREPTLWETLCGKRKSSFAQESEDGPSTAQDLSIKKMSRLSFGETRSSEVDVKPEPIQNTSGEKRKSSFIVRKVLVPKHDDSD